MFYWLNYKCHSKPVRFNFGFGLSAEFNLVYMSYTWCSAMMCNTIRIFHSTDSSLPALRNLKLLNCDIFIVCWGWLMTLNWCMRTSLPLPFPAHHLIRKLILVEDLLPPFPPPWDKGFLPLCSLLLNVTHLTVSSSLLKGRKTTIVVVIGWVASACSLFSAEEKSHSCSCGDRGKNAVMLVTM